MPADAKKHERTNYMTPPSPDRTIKVTDVLLSAEALAAREAALHRQEEVDREREADDLRSHLLSSAEFISRLLAFARKTILPDFAEEDEDKNNTFTHITETKKLSNVEVKSVATTSNNALPSVEDYYVLQKKIAEGGQGILCKARDRILNRMVAMKTLRPELVDNDEIMRSFITEAVITAQLEHPSIVSIYGLLKDDKKGVYLAMQLVHGRDMRALIAEQINNFVRDRHSQHLFDIRLPWCIEMFLKVCDAIAYAHSRGVIHCDLKPENIMFGEYGEVFVMDWGLARCIRDDGGKSIPDTELGHLDGTPRFIPPEAYLCGHRDERTDVYALGLILFELLTLQHAFDGNDVNEVIRQVRENDRRPLKHKFGLKIPSTLCAIINKASAYNPEDRYDSVTDLTRDLQRYLADDTVSAMPVTIWFRGMRWLRRHLRSVIICGMMGWLAAALIGCHAAHNDLLDLHDQTQNGKALEMRAADSHRTHEDLKFAEIDGNVVRNAMYIANRITALETSLRKLAGHTGEILENGSEAVGYLHSSDVVPVMIRSFRDDRWKSAGNGCAYSEAYLSVINPDCVTVTSRSKSETIDEKRLPAFYPVARMMRNLVLASYSGDVISGKENHNLLRIEVPFGKMPISRVRMNLSHSGLNMLYPGGSDSTVAGRGESTLRDLAAQAQNGLMWGSPQLDEARREWMNTCAVPITGPSGKNFGVASFDLIFENLNAVMFNDFDRNTPYLRARYLFTASGQLLTGMIRDKKGEFVVIDEKNAKRIGDEALKRLSASQTRFVNGHQSGKDGRYPVIYHYALIPSIDVYLIDETDPRKY